MHSGNHEYLSQHMFSFRGKDCAIETPLNLLMMMTPKNAVLCQQRECLVKFYVAPKAHHLLASLK